MAELGIPGLLQPGLRVHRRVARAGGRLAAAARCVVAPGIRRTGPPRRARSAYAGRLLLALASLLVLGSAQAQILSSRIWPAREYTRLTLESKEALQYT